MILELIVAGLFLMFVWWLFKSGVIWAILLGTVILVIFLFLEAQNFSLRSWELKNKSKPTFDLIA